MSEYKKSYLALFNGLSNIIAETDNYIHNTYDITAYDKLEHLVAQLKELQQKSEQLYIEESRSS